MFLGCAPLQSVWKTEILPCVKTLPEVLEIIGHNCFGRSVSFFLSGVHLLRQTGRLTFELFTFAATAVRQLRVWGLAGLPAPLPRLRLGLRRLLPRQRPLLRLGRPELLALLSFQQEVRKDSTQFILVSTKDLSSTRGQKVCGGFKAPEWIVLVVISGDRWGLKSPFMEAEKLGVK